MTASRAVEAAQIVTGGASGARKMMTPYQVDAVQDATALTAWWAVGAMLLEAIGAVAGGRLGAAYPEWHRRDRMQRPIRMADKI